MNEVVTVWEIYKFGTSAPVCSLLDIFNKVEDAEKFRSERSQENTDKAHVSYMILPWEVK